MPINVDAYEQLAGEVLRVYEDAEMIMMENLANRLYEDPYSMRWAEKKYGEMQAVNRQMRSFVGKLSTDRQEITELIISHAYEESGKAFLREAELANIVGISGLTPNATKVISILTELNNKLDVADRNILRQANDAYADIVGQTSALVATGTMTVREAVNVELNHFANRGIGCFVDQAGRQWDMETYAEMATLTAIEKATIEGYIDAMEEYGFDLAEISSHVGACPICEAWEGVIVSVSGETKGYPTLDEAEGAGVFHPRCLHDISTYYPELGHRGRSQPREVREANTAYAARAQQRSFERAERKWKRRMAVAGSPQEEREAYAHVQMYSDRIQELVAKYNAATPKSYDRLYRKKYREGPVVELSPEARKLEPFEIPAAQQAKHYDITR